MNFTMNQSLVSNIHNTLSIVVNPDNQEDLYTRLS